MHRPVVLFLSLALLALQYRLWVADGGISHTYRLRQQVEQFRDENVRLAARNAELEAEVSNLQSGLQAIEARARRGLGMVRRGETFYLVTVQSS